MEHGARRIEQSHSRLDQAKQSIQEYQKRLSDSRKQLLAQQSQPPRKKRKKAKRKKANQKKWKCLLKPASISDTVILTHVSRGLQVLQWNWLRDVGDLDRPAPQRAKSWGARPTTAVITCRGQVLIPSLRSFRTWSASLASEACETLVTLPGKGSHTTLCHMCAAHVRYD